MARVLALVGLLIALLAAPAYGQSLAPPFDQSYVVTDLGAPAGVPPALGGLTLKAGTTDGLLIGGAANGASGALYEIGLVRDGTGHITGFSGTATRFADAAFNDGGVTYGPGGVLFLARYPNAEIGQILPGSSATDKIVPLAPLGVAQSLGSLMFVPAGQPGAGRLKLASYVGGQWYDADVTPDGNGTYDVVNVTAKPGVTLAGPEGFVYVNPGSPQFTAPSVLVSEYDGNRVSAFTVDASGDPEIASRRDFITGLVGAEGAFVDPLTGDFLFSTFGGGDRVIVVRGFAPTPPALKVITRVLNDDGGSRTPASFDAHVLAGGADVVGSPRAGDDVGTDYSLVAGAYVVRGEAVLGYTASITGDCDPEGAVGLAEGDAKACTITHDDVAPTLRVVTRVVNDDGGSRAPGGFSVHVRRGGSDVIGSPRPGSAAGTTYTLPAGTYAVAADARAGYVTTTCSVTLAVGEAEACTITADDVAQQPSPPPDDELPPPVPHELVNALPADEGTVKVKVPGSDAFVTLEEDAQLPVGTTVDVTKGRITLVAASDASGGTATAEFYAGIFKLGQTKGSKPITTLKLIEKLSCAGAGKASEAARKKRKRRLWGSGTGRFRTSGRYSSATVRGTKWLTQDTCTTTLTKVTSGRVVVRDFVKRKNVLVRAGKRYIARRR